MHPFRHLAKISAFATAMALLAPAIAFAAEKSAAHGHGATVAAPKSATEAWGQINGRRAELKRLIDAKNLKAVHDATETLTAVVKALPGVSKDLPADKLRRAEGAVNNLTKALDATHDAADEGDQPFAEKQAKTVEALLKILAAQYPAEVANAAPVAVAASHDHGEAGHGHASAAEPTTEIEAISSEPLAAGKAAKIAVRLKDRKTGRPVTAADLDLAHTMKVHLLIVDPSLSDYHHEHPVETAPGAWSFTFTPRAGGEYVVFADLVPLASKAQEYARGTVKVAGTPRALEQKISTSATVDGHRYDLAIEGGKIPLSTGAMVKVSVKKPDGTPAKNLEPVMGAFAHGVGFTPDLKTVLHVHPLGEEPTSDSQRGGSELSFHIAPAAAGFYKFYVQVRIDGKDRFAGFGINVVDEPAAAGPNAQSGHGAGAMTLYCPMHPEVTSTKAGAVCQKCGGMKLVPKKS